MEKLYDPKMPTPISRRLFLDDLEEHLRDHKGSFYWLVKVLDEYYQENISIEALWVWIVATLNNTSSLHLITRFKIFLPIGSDFKRLDDLSEEVAKTVYDDEVFKHLCHRFGLPITSIEWDAFDTKVRAARFKRVETDNRQTRKVKLIPMTKALTDQASPTCAGPPRSLTAAKQPVRVDGTKMSEQPTEPVTPHARQTQASNQPARSEDLMMAQQLLDFAANPGTKSSTATSQPARTDGLNMAQQSIESSKPHIRQFGTPIQPTDNEDTNMVRPESTDTRPRQSDFTFQMPRNEDITTDQQLSKSTMPAPMSGALNTPAAFEKAAVPAKAAARIKPTASVKPAAPVKLSASASAVAPAIYERPVWKSPWKRKQIQLPPPLPNFPISDVRNEGKGKQRQESPPTYQTTATAPSFDALDGPYAEPLHKPVPAPDMYIEPLDPVPAPDLTGLPPQKQAELVYQQLLAHGERQKAITGKYRSLADEQPVQATKETGEDVRMGRQ